MVAVVECEFLQSGTDDGRTIPILRDRNRDGLTAAAWRNGDVPPARHDGVSLAHEKSVAGVGSRRRIVASLFPGVVHPGEGEDIAAVVDLGRTGRDYRQSRSTGLRM